jgi:hypothetical protein
MVQQSLRLESSGTNKAVEALGSTCVEAWASRSHNSCCRHGGTKPMGSGSSGACLPDASFQEPKELLQSQASKACRQWELWGLLANGLPETMAAATGTGEPSLQAAGVLGLPCWGMGSRTAVQQHCRQRGSTPLGNGCPGACLPAWVTRSHGSCCRHGGSKPAGSRPAC